MQHFTDSQKEMTESLRTQKKDFFLKKRNDLWRMKCVCTVHKNSKTQEGQITLSFYGVPANIRIAFSQEHRAALETTAS